MERSAVAAKCMQLNAGCGSAEPPNPIIERDGPSATCRFEASSWLGVKGSGSIFREIGV